jgi:hypothetical protein
MAELRTPQAASLAIDNLDRQPSPVATFQTGSLCGDYADYRHGFTLDGTESRS